MPDKLPCEQLFRELEKDYLASETCWAEAETAQSILSTGGFATGIACSTAIIKKTPQALAGCTLGTAAYISGILALSDKLDRCNELDLEAFKTAKEFDKCAGQHKEFLNSLLKPKKQ